MHSVLVNGMNITLGTSQLSSAFYYERLPSKDQNLKVIYLEQGFFLQAASSSQVGIAGMPLKEEAFDFQVKLDSTFNSQQCKCKASSKDIFCSKGL